MFVKLREWVKVDDFAVWDKEGRHTVMKQWDVVEVRDNEGKGLLVTYGNIVEQASWPVVEESVEPVVEVKKTTKKTTKKS